MVTKIEGIPIEEHFAVLLQNSSTLHHEGDERSHTNPGHGYPAYSSTITSIDYLPFSTEELLKKWLTSERNRDKKFRVIKVQPVNVEMSISVK